MREGREVRSERGVFYAGVVLYHPESDHHLASARILLEHGVRVVFADNSEDAATRGENAAALRAALGEGVASLSDHGGNIGLSAAFNRIVQHAGQDPAARGIFFFDQDTDVNGAALSRLLSSFATLQEGGALGVLAAYAVRGSGIPYRIRPRAGVPSPDPDLVPVDFAPSSFSLVPMEALRQVGPFQEDFFIDHIDLDFCLRCWQRGLPVFMDTGARFLHRIGHGDVLVGSRPLFPIGSPFRHYYQTRNIILSDRRALVPLRVTLPRIVLKLATVAAVGLYAGRLMTRLSYTFGGIVDGFRGEGGRIGQGRGRGSSPRLQEGNTPFPQVDPGFGRSAGGGS